MGQDGFNAGITGLGVYLPEKRMTEQDFINAGVPKEYIDMWGVYEHRVSEPDETPSDMSIKAAKDLIRNTGIDPKKIDLIIDSALVPDYVLPGNSHKIQFEIGAVNAGTIDIIPCGGGGAIPSLMIAKALIKTQEYNNVLITCSSKVTSVTDKTDWSTIVVPGDAAAAALVTRVDERNGILASKIITRGEFNSNAGIKVKETLRSKNKGMTYEDNSKKVLFFLNDLELDSSKCQESKLDDFYSQSVCIASKFALEKLNMMIDDVDFWIIHQNIEAVCDTWTNKLGITHKNNYYFTNDKYGNLYNANLLVNLKEAVDKCLIKDNDIIVLTGSIVGFSTGSIVIKWGK